MNEARIITVGYDDAGKVISRGTRGTADVNKDLQIMDKAVEFKYAAKRMNLVLVIDMVPPWKAKLLKLFGVRVGE